MTPKQKREWVNFFRSELSVNKNWKQTAESYTRNVKNLQSFDKELASCAQRLGDAIELYYKRMTALLQNLDIELLDAADEEAERVVNDLFKRVSNNGKSNEQGSVSDPGNRS